MVTIENSPTQSTGSAPQTQNPQQAPANLQPNQNQEGLQNVISSPTLFSNPQANAIVIVPSASGLTTESLLANEADTQTTTSQSNRTLLAILIVAVLVIAIGSYLIMKKLPRN